MAFLMPNKGGEDVLRPDGKAELKPAHALGLCFVPEQHQTGSANNGLWDSIASDVLA